MTTAVRTAVGNKRPRGYGSSADEPSLPWAGRVPKPAMDADSFVDYGSGFLRKSCDSCVSSKRRCDGQDPCTRCSRRKKPCHYTERKKCGPRSGQKTTTKMRRLYTAETQLRRRYTTETQPQQQRTNLMRHHTPVGSSRNPGADAALAGASSHDTTPTHSAAEVSGEASVDHPDYSDSGLPPKQVLLRDESGSSWSSLEDQVGSEMVSSARLEGAYTNGVSLTRHENHQRGAPRIVCTGTVQGAGLWSGLHSSTADTASGSGGSGGSAGESWEDDESEEGLGQAEEEVAVLLLGLGKANEEFEGFSDDEISRGGDGHIPGSSHTGGASDVSKPPSRHMSVSRPPQEWSV